MTATTDADSTAKEILEIIPLVMRSLQTELRQPSALPGPGHFHLLLTLVGGGLNLSELASRHHVTLPTMSKTVSTLVSRGLVRRSKSEQDRRQVLVALTQQGRMLLASIRDQAESHLSAMLVPLSAAEREELSAGLAVLKKVFKHTSSTGEPGGS